MTPLIQAFDLQLADLAKTIDKLRGDTDSDVIASLEHHYRFTTSILLDTLMGAANHLGVNFVLEEFIAQEPMSDELALALLSVQGGSVNSLN